MKCPKCGGGKCATVHPSDVARYYLWGLCLDCGHIWEEPDHTGLDKQRGAGDAGIAPTENEEVMHDDI